MVPYYTDDAVTIYHGDCVEILPTLEKADLVLADPPYGIGRGAGMGGGGRDVISRQNQRRYKDGEWDKHPIDSTLLAATIAAGQNAIIWGGQYYAASLPQQSRWLVWDKRNTMPSYSDAEVAWTNLSGNACKMIRHSNNGLMAIERERYHPTQKPLAVMIWCIAVADAAIKGKIETIIDPFAGSGTTGRAAKDLGRKCVLIEREERYCEIAANRMRQEVLPL